MEWQSFIDRPAECQLLEEAATFLAQWFQPEKDISHSDIDAELNNIAQEVLMQLKIEYPAHPIFFTSSEDSCSWRHCNIEESRWNDRDERRILYVLCKILREQNFHLFNEVREGDTKDEDTFEGFSLKCPRRFLINHVSYRSIIHYYVTTLCCKYIA